MRVPPGKDIYSLQTSKQLTLLALYDDKALVTWKVISSFTSLCYPDYRTYSFVDSFKITKLNTLL